jgi:hypothetical protein
MLCTCNSVDFLKSERILKTLIKSNPNMSEDLGRTDEVERVKP